MLTYPISVFLDTNIFIGCKYDISEEGILKLLKKHIEANRIKLYVSNVVAREVEKHISEDISTAYNKFKKARKEAMEVISPSIVKDTLLHPFFELPEKEIIKEHALQEFKKFLSETQAICLDNDGVDIDSILENYFAGKPPFEKREEKKYEFPDAIIISKLILQFSESNPVWIISGDKGFQNAFYGLEGFNSLSSIKELLDMINRQNELYDKIIRYISDRDVHQHICDTIEEKVEEDDIEINGMDYDRKGYCGGYDYEETFIESVTKMNFRLGSVNEINDNFAQVSLICSAKISALCHFRDYDNSIWDSEEKEYVFVSNEEVEEIHEAEFECILEFSIDIQDGNIGFSLSSIDYDIVLDQSTRIERILIQSDDSENDALGDMMDAHEEYYRH